MYLPLQVWKGWTDFWQNTGRNITLNRNRWMRRECLDRFQLCSISWLVCCVPQESHRQQTGEGSVMIQMFKDDSEQKYQIGETTRK